MSRAMLSYEFLLNFRILIGAATIIYAIRVLMQTRRIVSRPWCFVFIAIRVSLTMLLRLCIFYGFSLPILLEQGIVMLGTSLDLLTVVTMYRAYKELFADRSIP